MSAPKQPDRWDGWDDPDYQPTDDELNEPITLEGNPTPEQVAEALMKPSKPR